MFIHISSSLPLFRRLCSLSITRLTLMMPLPPDLTSLSLAVKMQSSKRTLRSHEIPVPQTVLTGSNSVGFASMTTGSAPTSLATCNLNNTSFGSIGGSGASPYFETDLDLHFSLQYPHFIKRDGNRFVIIFSVLPRRMSFKKLLLQLNAITKSVRNYFLRTAIAFLVANYMRKL